MTAWAVLAAYSPELVERRKVLHTVFERIAVEVAAPIAIDCRVVEAVHSTVVAAAPIEVDSKAAEVPHRDRVVVIAGSIRSAVAGLDHRT